MAYRTRTYDLKEQFEIAVSSTIYVWRGRQDSNLHNPVTVLGLEDRADTSPKGNNMTKLNNLIEVSCIHCSNKFGKDKHQTIKFPNHFCSRTCAAKHNNKIPKRKAKPKFCKKCSEQIVTKKVRTVCDSCLNKTALNSNPSILEVRGKRNYQKNSRIREWARKIMLASGQAKVCKFCPYDKALEVCHIKAIKDFSESSLVSEINSLDNLMYLCRNCHWEFDHGLTK